MSSVEFFTFVKEHLKDEGVMVVNMNMKGASEGNINQYLSDTIASVFGHVYTVDVANNTNRELFASDNPNMIEDFRRNSKAEDNPKLKDMINKVDKGFEKYYAGDYLMTDDKAPVELLGMKVIDELIHDEVVYYKGIFKKEGLKGLLSML